MSTKIALVIGLAILFPMTVLVLLRILPGPHKPTDFLVVGTLATFFCLAVLFLVNAATKGETKDTFYRKRK